ncbi:MAG: YeeE/YedE family protein [Gammaproteobacteria bacterium]
MDPQALALAHRVIWIGFVLATVFGAVAARTDFCALGAVYDALKLKRWGRMRAYFLAIAIAVIGANLLDLFGAVDLARSIYPVAQLHWLSNLVGGLLFGIGMVYAMGCAHRSLVRVGGGSLRALVILLVMGISGYMTLRGLFGQWRVSYLDPVSIDLTQYGIGGQDLASLFAGTLGFDHHQLQALFTVIVAGGFLFFVFRDRNFVRDSRNMLGGVGVGLLVVAAWYVTGHLAFYNDGLETHYLTGGAGHPGSYTFVAPVARTLEWLMLYTDASMKISFGIVSALGVVFGSFLWSQYSRTFRWEGFRSVADLRNALLAGVFMGFGGVTGMGCTIGQGITGVSTLAVGSMITLAGILLGAVLMYRVPVWWAVYRMNREDLWEDVLTLMKR